MSARVCSLALLCGSLACGGAAFGPEDADAIRSVMQRQQSAWNGGDIETFMQGYHRRPDVVFTSGGRIRKGWEETLAAYRSRYVEGDAQMGTLTFSDLEVEGLGPTSAVVLGHWRLTDTPQAGHGVFTLVFTEENGQWAIRHDHSSAEDTP